jgi:DNA-binding beta-propeller fold protein YncE
MNGKSTGWCVAVAVVLGWIVAATQAAEPLRLVETIPLAGVEGRIDHMAIDADGQRLFIAALGNNSLEVVDLAGHKVEHSIGGLYEPQGVAFLKDRALIAVANGDDGTCQLFDAKSFKLIDTNDFKVDADNVRYDPASQRLYVGFGDGSLGVIDSNERKRLADIKLSSHPESFQLESQGNRIFVNLPKSRQIAVVDRKQAAVVATWSLDAARANFPMALDERSHRLFIGCRMPSEVLVYDTESGKVVTHFSTVGDADDLFYDDRTKRLIVAGGEGFIVVHQQQDADQYSRLASIPTAAGARTALFAPDLARLYLAVTHRGSQVAELRVYEVVR